MSICIKSLFESRDLKSPCACPRCAQDRDHEKAIDHYVNNRPDREELFPGKETK